MVGLADCVRSNPLDLPGTRNVVALGGSARQAVAGALREMGADVRYCRTARCIAGEPVLIETDDVTCPWPASERIALSTTRCGLDRMSDHRGSRLPTPTDPAHVQRGAPNARHCEAFARVLGEDLRSDCSICSNSSARDVGGWFQEVASWASRVLSTR